MFRTGKFSLRGNSSGNKKTSSADPDYEEIEPLKAQKQLNSHLRNMTGGAPFCDLCGSYEAAVKCNKCNNQAFCFACDDMYHRHPKRSTHVRKAVDKGTKDGIPKPPLPRKIVDGPGNSLSPPPQPPPRKNKKMIFLPNQFPTKEQLLASNSQDNRNYMKKMLPNRPLPPTPDSKGSTMIKAESTGNLALFNNSGGLNMMGPSSLPRSIQDINKKQPNHTQSVPPPTPPLSSRNHYPAQPNSKPVALSKHSRKLSLQQFPPSIDDTRASLVESSAGDIHWESQGPVPAGKPPQKSRSQSISDVQWNQIVVPANSQRTGTSMEPKRGMVSSASVSDLNALKQIQPYQQYPSNMQANSFQQLNMMKYDGGNMMWMPCPCHMSQTGYPGQGMKRTTSNISMNLSSAASDTGYHWGPQGMHQHHLPFYHGYYPGYPPHMIPNVAVHGSAMSVPDARRHSPAPSVISSHRSRKSSRSRSFKSGTNSHRSQTRSTRPSDESEESQSYSGSDDEIFTSSTYKANRSWQCEHCTFINPAHSESCGMCSKSLASSYRQQKSSKKYFNRHQNGGNEREIASDYDRKGMRSNRSVRSDSMKSSLSRRRTKSSKNSRMGSTSSLSENDGDRRLEKQLKELRLSSKSRTGDYDGISVTSHSKKADQRGTYRSEGGMRYRRHGRIEKERPSTPVGHHFEDYDNTGSSSLTASTSEGYSNSSVEELEEQAPLVSSQDATLVGTKSPLNVDENVNIVEEKIHLDKCPSEESFEADNQKLSEIPGLPPDIAEVIKTFEEEQKKIPEKVSVERTLVPQRNKDEPADDPSIANTLDDVDTMATNEIADIEPTHGISTNDEPNLNNKLVEANVDDLTDIEMKDYDVFEKITFDHTSPNKGEKYDEIKPNSNIKVSTEPSYEQMEDDKPKQQVPLAKLDYNYQENENFFNATKPPAKTEKSYDSVSFQKQTLPQTPAALPLTPATIIPADNLTVLEYQKVPSAPIITTGVDGPFNIHKTPSLETSINKFSSPTPDRQCTPLSFSSSDAQFYSPPDSPVISLNGKRPDSFSGHSQTNERIIIDGKEEIQKAPSIEVEQYEGVPFEDALSSQDFPIRKSVSDQAISKHLSSTTRDVYENISSTKPRSKVSIRVEDEEDERFLSVEALILKRKQKTMKEQGLELVKILREAEDFGYKPEEVSIALTLCGDKPPLEWLQNNWQHMTDTVITLCNNYGQERKVNDIGQLTSREATDALRLHKGNIWAAVTECVEQRENKFNTIYSRGNFERSDILQALLNNEGRTEDAYLQLNKTRQLGSFSSKIWSPAEKAIGSFKLAKAAISQSSSENNMEDALYENVQNSETEEEIGQSEDEIEMYSEDGIIEDSGEELDNESIEETEDYTESGEEIENAELDEAPTGLYNSLFAPIIKKFEDTLHRASESMPRMTEEFKKKLSQAILEWENDPDNQANFFDSDDESTIEELLAVADNPSFYEYFTAVDVEDTEDYSEAKTHDRGTSPHIPQLSNNQSEERKENKETEQTIQKETQIQQNEQLEQELKKESSEKDEEFKTEKNDSNEDVKMEKEEPTKEINNKKKDHTEKVQFIRKEDVVVHPLKSFGHFADLSVVQYTDEDDLTSERENRVSTSACLKPADVSPPIAQTPGNPKNEIKPNLIKNSQIEAESQKKVHNQTETDFMNKVDKVEEEKEVIENLNENETENEVEDALDSEEIEQEMEETEEETDEELDLSEGDIIEEEDSLNVTTGRLSLSFTQTSSKEANVDIQAQTYQTEVIPASVLDEKNSGQSSHTTVGATVVESSSKQGPVTVQKATFIVGKAIAKAMARETTVKEINEIDETESPTDMFEQEEQYNSSDNEYDRTLETIPEEGSSALSNYNASSKDIQQTVPNTLPPTVTQTTKVIQGLTALENAASSVSKPASNLPSQQITIDTKTSSKSGTAAKSEFSPASKINSMELNPIAKKVSPELSPKQRISDSTGQGSSKTSLSSLQSRLRSTVPSRSTMDSSGESEDEDRMVNDLKTKGRNMNKEEVDTLKEEIRKLKEELTIQLPVDDNQNEEDQKESDLIQNEEEEVIEEDEQEKEEEDEQLKFDRTVRRLLAEGQAKNYEKAEMAAHLLNLSFDEADSINAAEECSSIYTAVKFLRQECELCAEKYPMGKIVSMLHCVHRCCYACAENYFTYQIKTKNIRELRCPFCNEPDLDSCEDLASEYLNNLDILLKGIIDEETHELFQRKLRDWTLMKDPNFRWCNKCSSGFIANPRARKLICPDCKNITCSNCMLQWQPQHEGISCDEFSNWKKENNPEGQAEGVAKHLAECGITCPKCKFTYSLAKGGCMHFTCTECKYEFCSGCGQPFKQGAKCSVSAYCEKLGLHAHHPRNCLFYLRDKEPNQLQQLLKESNVVFDIVPTEEWQEGEKKLCRVQEQKETVDGLRDDMCGRPVLEGHAGLCRVHYIEYLVEKINNHRLDPVSIFDEADLRVCLRRNGKTVPSRRWESEKLYKEKLVKLIKKELPLS